MAIRAMAGQVRQRATLNSLFFYGQLRRFLAGAPRTKIGLHCQAVPDHVANYSARAGAVAVKCIGLYRRFLGMLTIGRPYVDQNQVDNYVRGGVQGARNYWAVIREEVLKNKGLVDLWEPLNEASIWNDGVAANFVAFCQELIKLFHAEGLKIIIGGINTGWPRLPNEDGGRQIKMIWEACQGADGVSFHEYWWSDPMVGGATFRYRYFHNHLKSKGLTHPPIWITECGIDRGNGIGWRTVLNKDARKYAQQIGQYAEEVQKDPYIKGVFMFTAGPCGWEDFDMNVDVCNNLVPILNALPPWKDEEEPPMEETWGEPTNTDTYVQGFDISAYQGKDFDWDEAARDSNGYKFVIMRIGNGLDKDIHFERNWAEAGKRHFVRGVYHTVWPNLNGQAAAVRGWLAGRESEMGIWGAHDMGGFDSERLGRYFTAMDRETGQKVGLYSRATLLDPLGAIATWAAGRWFWPASWGVNWPIKPKEWKWGWKLWQISSDGIIAGKRVDLNKYHGNLAAFRAEFGGQDPKPVEPEPENKPPVARFGVSCTGLSCRFDASQSYDPDGTIVSYEWMFGDGATGDGQTGTHVYITAGIYDVTLTVADDEGATDVEIVRITVSEPDESNLEKAMKLITSAQAHIKQADTDLAWAVELLEKEG